MIKRFHTIIIGAGIAGLNAARFLEKDGLVLESKAEIGLPVRCAEGISLNALQREGLRPLDDWVAQKIHAIRLVPPNGRTVGERLDAPCGVTLKRDRFEKRLADLVKHPILLNSRVLEITRDTPSGEWILRTSPGEVYRAKYLIGADGPCSFVGRRIFGGVNPLIPGLGFELAFTRPLEVNDELYMYLGSGISPGGYAWVFPLSEDRANVGLVSGRPLQGIKVLWERFLKTTIGPRYGGYRILRQKTGPIPMGGIRTSVVKDNVLLVGDAGGFTDPIFKGGMNAALLTGRWASECINLDRPEAYTQRVHDLPFSNRDLLAARDALFGLGDDVLNALGDTFEHVGMSALQHRSSLLYVLLQLKSRRKFLGLSKFVKTWLKAENTAW